MSDATTVSSEAVIEALKTARTEACPGWCPDTRPGVHAHCILSALLALAVEQRMEAMGMERVVVIPTEDDDGDPVIAVDTYSTAQRRPWPGPNFWIEATHD